MGEWGIVRLTSAGASQQIMGKSSVKDDHQLKALKAVMISKEFLMRICEGGITSLEVKCTVLRFQQYAKSHECTQAHSSHYQGH